MTIDPLKAVIVWLAVALTSVSGRVAGKHRYGEGWTEAQTGVSVHLDGGAVDLYGPVATPRMEIRIYADDQVKIVDVWRELVGLSRTNARFEVQTSHGKALIQYFNQESSLSLLYDDVLNMDMGIVFCEAMVAEETVT